MNNLTHEAIQQFDIQNADRVDRLQYCTVCYYTTRDGKPGATMYIGKSKKPAFRYFFKNEQARDTFVKTRIDNLTAWKTNMAERKAERNNYQHTLKTGDILVSTWGYDQTNVDFYQVVEVKDKSVVVREIEGHLVNGEDGFMSGRIMPVANRFKGQPMTKRVSIGNYIKITDYAVAQAWSGKPVYCSWYAQREEKMPKKLFAIRMSKLTENQIEELIKLLNLSKTELFTVAINDFYNKHIGNKNKAGE